MHGAKIEYFESQITDQRRDCVIDQKLCSSLGGLQIPARLKEGR